MAAVLLQHAARSLCSCTDVHGWFVSRSENAQEPAPIAHGMCAPLLIALHEHQRMRRVVSGGAGPPPSSGPSGAGGGTLSGGSTMSLAPRLSGRLSHSAGAGGGAVSAVLV